MSDLARSIRGGRLAGARPTMKDVATRAGVALKTVSRVVNGEPGVTPATATRVLDAIEDLGFRRNESARLLRTGRTSALGLIADDFGDADTARLLRGVEDVARDRGMLLFAGSTDRDPDREQQLALTLTARRVDGLIMLPATGAQSYLLSEIEAGTVTVFVLRPPADVQADTVLADERGGARAAVAHLAGRGHRRIGFLGGEPGSYRQRELLAGYGEAMAGAGITADGSWSRLTADGLARSEVTAVFCGGREQTAKAMCALADRGRSGQVAVVGFGDFELADCYRPGVTVVAYDAAEVGRAAAQLLFRRIDGEGGPARRVTIPTRLVARGSGELAPRAG